MQIDLDQPENALQSASAALAMGPDRKDILQAASLAQLASGLGDDALKTADRAVRLDTSDQLSLAYLTTARELTDDRAGGQFDYINAHAEKRVHILSPDEGARASMNKRLRQRLEQLHASQREPLDQSLRGGTQLELAPFLQSEEIIGQLAGRFKATISDYIAALPDNPDDPWLSRKPETVDLAGIWSVRLRSEGFHVSHVHPQGWLSAVYYVALPEEVTQEGDHDGWLRLGEPPVQQIKHQFRHRDFQPEEGALIMFPSFLWHGTLPFTSQQPRMTIAFDVKPGRPPMP